LNFFNQFLYQNFLENEQQRLVVALLSVNYLLNHREK